MVPTFIIKASCLCFQLILYAGLQLNVLKFPPKTVSYEERYEDHREPSPGRWRWVIKLFPSKMLRHLFVAAAVCGWVLSWRRTISENNIPSRLFWNKGIELQHMLHIWQETLVLGMFTGSLRAQNWQEQCVAINEHTRDIAQHICTKVFLIFTVVLISQPIGPWKKIVLIY